MSTRGPYESYPTPANPATLPERLRWLRKRFGYTQAELAGLLGCEQNSVSSWESDRTRPGTTTLQALARLYRIPLDVLEAGEDFLAVARQAQETVAQEKAFADSQDGLPTDDLGPVPRGRIGLKDLASGEKQLLDADEAWIYLMTQVRKGRQVWIMSR
jgi:transcriptional regulator with XRE-family HTH domain